MFYCSIFFLGILCFYRIVKWPSDHPNRLQLGCGHGGLVLMSPRVPLKAAQAEADFPGKARGWGWEHERSQAVAGSPQNIPSVTQGWLETMASSLRRE